MLRTLGLATAFTCSTALGAFAVTMVPDIAASVERIAPEMAVSPTTVAATVPAPMVLHEFLTVTDVAPLAAEPVDLVPVALVIGTPITPVHDEINELTLAIATMPPASVNGFKPMNVEQANVDPSFDLADREDGKGAELVFASARPAAPRAPAAPVALPPQLVISQGTAPAVTNPNGMWMVGVVR